MEVEYITLSQEMRDVLTFVSIMKEIEVALKLQGDTRRYCGVFSKMQSQFKKTIKGLLPSIFTRKCNFV